MKMTSEEPYVPQNCLGGLKGSECLIGLIPHTFGADLQMSSAQPWCVHECWWIAEDSYLKVRVAKGMKWKVSDFC